MRLIGFVVLLLVALAVALGAGWISPHDSILGVSAGDVGHAVRAAVDKAFR